jgi:hypothetical protein
MFAAESTIVTSTSEIAQQVQNLVGIPHAHQADLSQRRVRFVRFVPANPVPCALVRVYILARNKKVPLFEQVAVIKVATPSVFARFPVLSTPGCGNQGIFFAYINNIGGPKCQISTAMFRKKFVSHSPHGRLNCAIIAGATFSFVAGSFFADSAYLI